MAGPAALGAVRCSVPAPRQRTPARLAWWMGANTRQQVEEPTKTALVVVAQALSTFEHEQVCLLDVTQRSPGAREGERWPGGVRPSSPTYCRRPGAARSRRGAKGSPTGLGRRDGHRLDVDAEPPDETVVVVELGVAVRDHRLDDDFAGGVDHAEEGADQSRGCYGEVTLVGPSTRRRSDTPAGGPRWPDPRSGALRVVTFEFDLGGNRSYRSIQRRDPACPAGLRVALVEGARDTSGRRPARVARTPDSTAQMWSTATPVPSSTTARARSDSTLITTGNPDASASMYEDRGATSGHAPGMTRAACDRIIRSTATKTPGQGCARRARRRALGRRSLGPVADHCERSGRHPALDQLDDALLGREPPHEQRTPTIRSNSRSEDGSSGAGRKFDQSTSRSDGIPPRRASAAVAARGTGSDPRGRATGRLLGHAGWRASAEVWPHGSLGSTGGHAPAQGLP